VNVNQKTKRKRTRSRQTRGHGISFEPQRGKKKKYSSSHGMSHTAREDEECETDFSRRTHGGVGGWLEEEEEGWRLEVRHTYMHIYFIRILYMLYIFDFWCVHLDAWRSRLKKRRAGDSRSGIQNIRILYGQAYVHEHSL
jgi:hypothetical protein